MHVLTRPSMSLSKSCCGDAPGFPMRSTSIDSRRTFVTARYWKGGRLPTSTAKIWTDSATESTASLGTTSTAHLKLGSSLANHAFAHNLRPCRYHLDAFLSTGFARLRHHRPGRGGLMILQLTAKIWNTAQKLVFTPNSTTADPPDGLGNR